MKSEVRLSLEDYNELIFKQKELEGIVEGLINIKPDPEGMANQKKHGGWYYVSINPDLTNKYLVKLIEKKYAEAFNEPGFEVLHCGSAIAVGSVKFVKPKNCPECGEELTEENEVTSCGKAFCKNCCPTTCSEYREGACYYYKKYNSGEEQK